MKRSLSFAFLAAFLFSTAVPQSFAATNRIDGPCKVAKQKAKIGSVAVTCTKVGSKLVWKKTVVKKNSAAPKASAPSAKPSSPSATANPNPASGVANPASPTAQSAYAININTGSWFFNFTYLLDGVKGALKSSQAKSNVLVLPVGKLVQLTLTNSSDVGHGIWVPALLLDKEVLPGNKASLEFTPDAVGTYNASCNVSCGRGHSTMTLKVEVVSEAEFLKYLSGLKA